MKQQELWLYDCLSRLHFLSYRSKIMAIAFFGTHIPLIALVAYIVLKTHTNWVEASLTLGIALVATLIGTGATLFTLNHLLRPVLMASQTLRTYAATRDLGGLPTQYTDEVGTLMADAEHTISHLEQVRNALEYLDTGTGLPNRKKLLLDLERAFEQESRVYVCVMRFANHSRIGETLDHATAEKAGLVVAERLQAAMRVSTLYRYDDHHFVLVTNPGIGSEMSPEEAHTRLLGLIAQSTAVIPLKPVAVFPDLLAGLATYPEDGRDPGQLIDRALGAASIASGEFRVNFYSAAARQAALDHLQLEQELRHALEHDEFVLHYQPVINLERGRITGAEALIRWQHPKHGLLAPVRFIGTAEESGLIDAIGLWVLGAACRQVRQWNDAGMPALKMAVNVSARQFADRKLVDHVEDALVQANIPAEQLEVELTETAAMVDEAHTLHMFTRLRGLGVSIAVDDFGTAYASLSYLRRLPFDKLKIEREFVQNVHLNRGNQAICEALAVLSERLGLELLAEGAEAEEGVMFLRNRGCTLFQGYYFSRPPNPAEFRKRFFEVSATALATRLRPDFAPSVSEALQRGRLLAQAS